MKKPYLILIPGWGMSSSVWDPIKNDLAYNFELIFINWENINCIDDFTGRVSIEIINHKMTLFSIVGWSLGSLVALQIASAFKNQIDKLILFSSTSCFINKRKEGYNLGWSKLVLERMKKKLDKQSILVDFIDKMFSDEDRQKGLDKNFLKYEYTNNVMYNSSDISNIMNSHSDINNIMCNSNNIKSLSFGLDYLTNTDLRNELGEINCPVLLIHGDKDKICPVDACEFISDRISSKVIKKVFPGVGHVPHHSNPIECIETIIEFMNIRTEVT